MSNTPSKSRDEKMMRQQDQIAEMRDIQTNNGLSSLPMVQANRNPKYSIRADEAEKFVFVRCCVNNFQQKTNSMIPYERIIPIHANQFEQKIEEKMFATYHEVEIIHDPRKNAKSYSADDLKGGGVVKLDQPKQSSNNNAQLNERVKALNEKEKDLLAKQADLEAREAALKAKEEALIPSVTK